MASINRGDNTGAFGNDFLRIYLNNPNELYIQKAVFQINDDLTKEYYDPIFPLRVNFSGEETNLLRQVNTCKLALWDEHGRRRTADGKFTFFVKENRISEPDSPDGDDYIEYPEEVSLNFDLTDAEFAAEFVVNATPQKMSELQQDIYLMTPDKVIGGRGISTSVSDGYVTIDADIDKETDYNNLLNKPKINGVELVGDLQIDIEEQVQADWNEQHIRSKSYIRNKPFLANVAITANYNDLVARPYIPVKTSDLTNDSGFIDSEGLDNYYTKEEVDEKIDIAVDLTPVYERIGDVETDVNTKYIELNDKIDLKADTETLNNTVATLRGTDTALRNSINNNKNRLDAIDDTIETLATKEEVDDKATREELETALNNTITTEEFNEALSKKANKTSIGNGKLSVFVNEELQGEFTANNSSDVNINIEIPTKTSELDNDAEFVTAEEISLDTIVTKEDLQTGLATKVNITELGAGILSIQKNNDLIGTFNANSFDNKTINIEIPTKTSELDNDAEFLVADSLDYIDTEIETINENLNTQNNKINTLTDSLDTKVDRKTGYSLMANSEINRLSHVDNYDDTELRETVTAAAEKVDEFDADISNKVDKEDGKGLSSNDFTDLYKDSIESNTSAINTLNTNVSSLNNTTSRLNTAVTNLSETVSTLETDLGAETTARINGDNHLQEQIDAMEAKSQVVDILGSLEDLDVYDTSKLQENDVICILNDETRDNAVTYYRWNGTTFTYIGSEGSSYKKAEADERFALKSLEINGHPLTDNVELTASDVNALPSNTVIGDGIITIQVKSQSVSNIDNIEQVDTFNVNSVENIAIPIPIPTKTSQLKNDLNFVELDVLTQSYLGSPKAEYGDGDNTLLWDKCYFLQDKIAVNTEHIEALEGNLPVVALTGNYYDLKNLPREISTGYKTFKDVGANTATYHPDYTAYIDETFISEMEEIGGFITSNILEEQYALKTEIPTQVSQLDNDRGYVTNNAIGRADLTIYLADEVLGTFNANSKEDKAITVPVDTELSTESIKPIQNKLVTNELNLKAYDSEVVHNTGNETVSGTKTINSLLTSTQAINIHNKTAATTEFVNTYYNDKDQYLVHKAQAETLTGNKTFTGVTTLSETHLLKPNTNDNSNRAVTSEWVKDQHYALDSNVVHNGSVGSSPETISGNKTFAEIVTFEGIVNLGSYAHVTTNGTVNDCPANVQYVNNTFYKKAEVDALLQAKENEIIALQNALAALTARVETLED